MRFEEKKDHYLDVKTGLKWSKKNFGPISWEAAMISLPEGWRLPTIEELFSIVDYAKHEPATDLPYILSADYWSSTTHAVSSDYAWNVHFHYGNGNYYYKSSTYYVRAVCYL